MITINDALKNFNGEKEIEIDAPHGINFNIDGITFLVKKKGSSIEITKTKMGSVIVVEQEYSNKATIK